VFHSECIRAWWTIKISGPKYCAIFKCASFVEEDSDDEQDILQPAGPFHDVIDMMSLK
jgi:hypothetical protein